MKKLFNPYSSESIRDFALLLLRLSVGALLITHGFPKFQKLISGNEIQFASVFGLSPTVSMTMAMLAEFFCAAMVFMGVFTRLAAIPVIITMLVIVFKIHGSDPLSNKEMPLLYLISYLTIFLCGPGKYSVDYFLYNSAGKGQRAR